MRFLLVQGRKAVLAKGNLGLSPGINRSKGCEHVFLCGILSWVGSILFVSSPYHGKQRMKVRNFTGR
jgi:hypothetical protein